jgi:hypothetical protein
MLEPALWLRSIMFEQLDCVMPLYECQVCLQTGCKRTRPALDDARYAAPVPSPRQPRPPPMGRLRAGPRSPPRVGKIWEEPPLRAAQVDSPGTPATYPHPPASHSPSPSLENVEVFATRTVFFTRMKIFNLPLHTQNGEFTPFYPQVSSPPFTHRRDHNNRRVHTPFTPR